MSLLFPTPFRLRLFAPASPSKLSRTVKNSLQKGASTALWRPGHSINSRGNPAGRTAQSSRNVLSVKLTGASCLNSKHLQDPDVRICSIGICGVIFRKRLEWMVPKETSD